MIDPKKFLNYSIPERTRLLIEDHNPDYVYELLSARLGKPVDELKEMFSININQAKQNMIITGSQQDIALLFFYTQNYGLEYESVSIESLRVHLARFASAIR